MAFKSHGTLSFIIEDDILIIEGTGPWNHEAIIESADAARPCHEALIGKPWGVLALIHGQPFHTPEAAELLSEIVRKDKACGRVASALLLDESSNPELGSLHIMKIYGDSGETARAFSNREEAILWLKDQIRNFRQD